MVRGANLRLSNEDLDRFDEVFRDSAVVGFQLDAARWLLDRGVGTAIVTLGAGGAVLATGTQVEHFAARRLRRSIRPEPGTYSQAAGFAEGLPIAQSIRYGMCAAALSTTRMGVIESIPSRAGTIDFMNARAAGGR